MFLVISPEIKSFTLGYYVITRIFFTLGQSDPGKVTQELISLLTENQK